MSEIIHESTYLFAQPSFLSGMAQTLDLGGTFVVYNESASPADADVKALKSDWSAIGKDLAYSLENYRNAGS